MDREILEARGVELIKLVAGQMHLVEVLVLRHKLLLLRRHNLSLLFELVLHQVLQLLPKVNLLGWIQVDAVLTLLRF